MFFKRKKPHKAIPTGRFTRENLKGLTEDQYIEIILSLQTRLELLEQKVAQLMKNSSTSSKPPSSDITRPPRENSRKKRKQGAQQGHEGTSRTPFSPEQVNERVDLSMTTCPQCNSSVIPHTNMSPLVQQVIRLPEQPMIITEYIRPCYQCSQCGQIHYAPLPEGVIEGQLFDLRLQGMIGYMKGALHCSYSNLKDFFEHIFKITISRGLLCQTVERVSETLATPYEALRDHLKDEALLHCDESGWKETGKRMWAWCFATPAFSFFSIELSRSSKVLEKILGSVFTGTLISDFFSAYVKYANALQQFCLAHLIRDIKFLITLPNTTEQYYGKRLLRYCKHMFRLWHKRNTISRKQFRHKRDLLLRRIKTFLQTSAVDPPAESARIIKRLEKHWDAIFRFLFLDGLEPTNNLVERAIRALIVDRRVTQGSRSLWGRQWSERSWTVLSTCKKQQRSAWDFIQQSLNAFYYKTTYPSLIPQT